MKDLPFLFGTAEKLDREEFVLRIPRGMRTKDDLLLCYAEMGRFPSYFGRNWDAFEELLRDFSWIAQPRILLSHEDLPLRGNEKELKIYLDILRSALTKPGVGSPILSVRFPSDVRDELVRALNKD